MRNILAFGITLFLATAALADPQLVGTWHSNRELTMLFAQTRAKLEDKTVLFLDQMMGRATLHFTTSRVRSVMPDWESTTAEGLTSKLVGYDETHSYKLIGTTRDQVAVAFQEPVTGRRRITVYNFEDENTMWVYLGGAPFPRMNIREYFRRVN